MSAPRRYWLMKSEPGEYSIDDLARDRRDWWTGVRNYQARNFMRDEMARGDGVLFYHSSCPQPGVAGRAEVCAAARPDPTQFDSSGDYYDSAAAIEKPRWFCVQIAFKEKWPLLPLNELRASPALREMLILRRGNRLSITPVTPAQWRHIVRRCGGKG